MAEEPKSIFDVMKKEGIQEGSRLEITLFEGTEYYDGWSPAPVVNPKGYRPPIEEESQMTKNPGKKVTGYVTRFEEDSVFLSPEWKEAQERQDYNLGVFFVKQECIHSYLGCNSLFLF